MPASRTAHLGDIQIRDPFVLTRPDHGDYWLYGSTDTDIWGGRGTGFDTYRSTDLEQWEGSFPAFRPPAGFWATENFWAPEVFRYDGRYYMFATFFEPGRMRGTQVLVADDPAGPFTPWSEGPVTPANWMCLDGTLHVDAEGDPWIVYCHEWLQVHDGAMFAQRLTADLRATAGRPVFLFSASDAPWSTPHHGEEVGGQVRYPVHVTDGPFLHRLANGHLVMLWSSHGVEGYAMGLAHSESGTVVGPWRQDAEPLWARDGGHGMIARTLDGGLLLTLHQPNDSPNERAVFRRIVEDGDGVRVA